MKNWILCLALGLLVGCSGSQKVLKQPPMPSLSIDEYSIGIGDQLSIDVWKSPELSISVPVRPDGKVSVPLIGDIVAAGETSTALSASLSERFSKYLRNPQVTVIVVSPVSGEYLRRVSVTGAVATPLSLVHRQGMTVLSLVLEAGGLNEFAVGNRAQLYRKVDGKVQVYPINLDDILNKGQLETNYQLAPSDIITVPERSF